ncbi:glycerol-3-phosphate 1-O-acyltransferase PlsY [Miniphocaeibacter massiliensis]|uniref:glycerol-3-phosphate 1-O-acyltransferase PlsY n=1 Tax=Miniphocaeibacter massiliensis TaxID=2041841 RepID=UPI000C07D6D4|nr:glycerol-3-phosphate 1-O-acyltransferase PlsY [Miniphocaeibacter massiliensis]
MKIILIGIIAYFIGNISGGIILSKLVYKQDIREHGSGNAGSTNALRVFGKKAGAFTFIIDFLKGLIITYVGGKLQGDLGVFVAGLFVVLGHDWPAIYGFKGGKGIATSFGVLVAISPIHILAVFVIFVIVVVATKYVSLGSIIAALLCILVGGYFILSKNNNYIGILYIVLALITTFKHRANIKRLFTGKETKIKLKK